MIKLLAPISQESVNEGATTVIECDQDIWATLAIAIIFAFEDPDSVPEEHRERSREVYDFFVRGKESP